MRPGARYVEAASRPRFDGQSGAGLFDLASVVHLVEVRSGYSPEKKADVWRQDGPQHGRAELANQAADKLRAQGFTVRVRPLVLR